MFAVHSSRQEGNGPDTSAFRFPLIEDEQDLCQLPRSQIETQTKLLSYRTMPKDLKLDQSLTEKGTESKKPRRSSTDVDEDEGSESKDSRNLTETFVAVIAQGILSVPSKRMTLSSIYNFIAKTFPHFDKEKGPGWRNSVRHNLSSNDCFVKASRAENGKGHYWMIHPKDLPEFAKGNYRRPRKPRRPRCSHALGCSTDRGVLGLPLTASLFPYLHHKPSTGLDLPKPHPSNEPFSHPFGVAPNRTPLIPASSRYDFYAREADTARFPLNQFHGFSSPPPPYGLFWQDNPSFRNYSSHFQSSTFHPYLYMSSVSQSENAIGLNYA